MIIRIEEHKSSTFRERSTRCPFHPLLSIVFEHKLSIDHPWLRIIDMSSLQRPNSTSFDNLSNVIDIFYRGRLYNKLLIIKHLIEERKLDKNYKNSNANIRNLSYFSMILIVQNSLEFLTRSQNILRLNESNDTDQPTLKAFSMQRIVVGTFTHTNRRTHARTHMYKGMRWFERW